MAAWAEGSGAPDDRYGFAYDQAGERVLRYRLDGTTLRQVEVFLRDEAGNVLSELAWDDAVRGSATTRSWTRTADWVYLGREPLVRIGSNPRTYATLVTDHLGSTRAEVTSTTPLVFTETDLWPYGDLVTQPAILHEKHLFTAHEREFLGADPAADVLAPLDHMHQREYTHRYGRFLSIDPVLGDVGSSQSWNRYSYVLGNPTNWVDPWGLATCRVEGDRITCEDTVTVTASDPAAEAAEFGREIARADYMHGDPQTTAIQAGHPDGASSFHVPRPGEMERGSGAEMTDEECQQLLEAISADEVLVWQIFGPETAGELYGAQSCGSPLDLLIFAGAAGLVRGAGQAAAYDAQQQALVALARESLRKGVTREEAEILKAWAREYGVRFRGPEIHPDRPFNLLHLHIGPVRHIPVR